MELITATVITTSPFTVQFDGEDTPSTRVYNRLASYSPTIGDKVVFLYQNSLYICIGKVV